MQVGLIGLGRMGSRIRDRLARAGHQVLAYDQDPATTAVPSIEAVVAGLAQPRVVWVMVPSGAATDTVFTTLEGLVAPGDLLVDGGNSDFRDSMRRAERLDGLGIHFLDVGVSGGVYGGERGFCLMAGGPEADYRTIEPLAAVLAAPDAYARVGPSGAGHYTKMCHNAIEYAIMEALGEGFDLLNHFDAPIDARRVADLWNHGSVIRSWLLELAGQALEKDPDLSKITGYVEDSGEGRWAIREAVERGVPATGLADSLFRRFASRERDSYATRLIAALRDEFGQHGTVPRDA